MNFDDKVDVQIKVLKENEFSVEISHEIFRGIPIIEEEKKSTDQEFEARYNISSENCENNQAIMTQIKKDMRKTTIKFDFTEGFAHNFWINIFEYIYPSLIKNAILYKKIGDLALSDFNRPNIINIINSNHLNIEMLYLIEDNRKYLVKLSYLDLKKIRSPSVCHIYKKTNKGNFSEINNTKFFEKLFDLELKKLPDSNQIDLVRTFQSFDVTPFFQELRFYGIFSYLIIELYNREEPFNQFYEGLYSISKLNFNSIADCSFSLSYQRMQSNFKFEIKQSNSKPIKLDEEEKKVFVRVTGFYQNNHKNIDLLSFFEIQNSSIISRIKPTKERNLIGFVYQNYAQLEEFFIFLIKLTHIESFISLMLYKSFDNLGYRQESQYKMISINRNYEIHFSTQNKIYPIIERVEGFPREYKEYLEKMAQTFFDISVYKFEKFEYFESIFKTMINLHLKSRITSNSCQTGLRFISKILQFFNDKMSHLKDFRYEFIEVNNLESDIFVVNLRLLSKIRKEYQFKVRNDQIYLVSENRDRERLEKLLDNREIVEFLQEEWNLVRDYR